MTTEPDLEPDPRIARALASLDPPEQRDDFFATLKERALSDRPPVSGRLGAAMKRRPRALLIATAVIGMLLGATAGALAANAASGQERQPVVLAFAPAVGWNTLQSRDPRNPDVQFAWAANVPFAPDDRLSGEPTQTAKVLPADGIVVYASMLPSVPDASGYRDVEGPIELADGEFFSGMYENQPAANVSKVQINAHVGGRFVYVEVMFGTENPSARLRDEAQQQLGRLLVPPA
jgi:hypothetical protein